MSVGVFVLCFVVPGNALKHCHNNGWLSLPHNKPLATLRSQKGGQLTQEVWPQCVVAGVLK